MTFHQKGIPKLVIPIAMYADLSGDLIKDGIVSERAEKFEVAFPRLMYASEDRIDNLKGRSASDSSGRHSATNAHTTVG